MLRCNSSARYQDAKEGWGMYSLHLFATFFASHETILMDPCYVSMLWFAEHVILFEQLFTALCKKGQIKTTNQIRLCVYFCTLPNIEVKLTYNIHSKQASVYLFALSSSGDQNIETLKEKCQHMGIYRKMLINLFSVVSWRCPLHYNACYSKTLIILVRVLTESASVPIESGCVLPLQLVI